MPHRRVIAPFAVLGLFAAADAGAAVVVAGVTVDPARATTTAEVMSMGYYTPHGLHRALPSNTSADWSVVTSLGSRFLRPPFQSGYSATTPVYGAAGTAVTIGQEPSFPDSRSAREIIRLTFGGDRGLNDGDGDDLAIFEQATSEAFALSVHVALGGDLGFSVGWRDWFYIPYEDAYDSDNDATPTLVDLGADLGLPGVTINAIELTSLAPDDTVEMQIDGADPGLGWGRVTFGGASGGLTPARDSSSQRKWVPFESTKFDPDIQYVVGLHDLVACASCTISEPGEPTAGSAPTRVAATGTPAAVPVLGTLPLLLGGLSLLAVLRRTAARGRWRG
jgi:hypothetical protein